MGPPSVARFVSARLRQRPPAVATVARALAILGDDASLADTASVAGLDRDATARAVDQLIDAELLHRALPPRFLHPIIQQALADSIPPAEQAQLHLSAARELARDLARCERAAVHLLGTPPAGERWAFDALTEAARRAGDELVTLAGRSGAEEVAFGMAHRGRLAVLAHNLGRSVESILAEFEGAKQIEMVKAVAAIPHGGTGDVKYHYGHQGIYETHEGEKVAVRLFPNPSHLEFVDPVVEGATRFLQSEIDGAKLRHEPKHAVPVLLHGDAAFPGQGVVAETLNLQALRGYTTGGTIHIIQDNQVGFTTDPEDARSTPYAADMAKGFNVPIVHVNADDVEACSSAIRLAMAYRERWGRDIVIDVIGYRRFGHNETDEPAYTQPAIAAKIKAHPPVSEIYAEKLIEEGTIGREDVERAREERHDEMSAALKDLRRKMELGEYEDPTVTTSSTGELDRSASPPVETTVPDGEAGRAERGPARGAGQLHDPPQAAQTARQPRARRWPRAGSSSATPRRSPSPRC